MFRKSLFFISLFVLMVSNHAAATTTIRILTTYDDNVLSGYQNSVSQVNAAINVQIANLNTAFANSNIDVIAQSAGTTHFNSGVKTIEEMAKAAQKSLPLRLTRDRLNADVVMVLGYFGTGFGSALQVGSTPETAFAAVDLALFTVNGYQHEFGHLLGARHQLTGGEKNDDTTPGAAHGAYIRVSSAETMCNHTIMAYRPVANLGKIACNSVPILWYSTPNAAVTNLPNGWIVFNPSFGGYIGGGINSTGTYYYYDNSKAIRENAPAVANFRYTRLSPKILAPIGSIIGLMSAD